MYSRIETARAAYFVKFGVVAPMPFGVGDAAVAEALERAIADGVPLPDSYEWWADLPPDAVA